MNFSKEVLAVFTILYQEEELFKDSKHYAYRYEKHIKTPTGTLHITRTLKGYIKVRFEDIDANTIYYKEIEGKLLKDICPTALEFVDNIVLLTDGTMREE